MVEMAEPSKRPDAKTALKDALLEIRRLRSELDKERMSSPEPVAVVGMACRFPGGITDPESYWRLLRGGQCAIKAAPENRWDGEAWFDLDPDATGRLYTQHGGYLSDVDAFDPDVFGISPREAKGLDPQQRMLLEVSWEALERAALPAAKLRGSDTGVYIGISTDDYAHLSLGVYESIDAWSGLGTMRSVAAGRIAYTFGLEGPALSFDTSCSSSLTAIHQACRDLQSGAVSTAVAGGVNLILTPRMTIALCRLRALSPDGLCRTFDASANGYVRGEGCGVVILKRLEQAKKDGDTILAVIRGSAINHDGRSNGLTAPNGQAQERLLRKALKEAGVKPGQVQYIEAHGTATSLGDPIEVHALGEVYGPGHSRQRPLRIGSVKTNIGHLEAAAGVAGFIKTVLSLQHREIVPHLHFENPNPYIAWERFPLAVPVELEAWESPADGEERRAAVSAFGMSGTNVHVVLEEFCAGATATPTRQRPWNLLALTAPSDGGLDAVVDTYWQFLGSRAKPGLENLCYSANTGRTPLNKRAAFAASSHDGLLAALEAHLKRRDSGVTGTDEGHCIGAPSQVPAAPRIAFLFTGQGAQYQRMGRELYDTQPVFSETLDYCNEVLQPILGLSLRSLIDAEPDLLNQTRYTQPVLFSLGCSLYRLWESWGVCPHAVMGHSVGEYVAAWAAGVFDLEQGLILIAERARLMQSMPGSGAMVAVLGPEEKVRDILPQFEGQIEVAALNGPGHVVLSGNDASIGQAVEILEGEGFTCRLLDVSHAFHSSQMDGMLADLEAFAAGIDFRDPTVPLISNLTGRSVGPGEIGPGYWSAHTRQAVRFREGVQALAEAGCRIFVEIGPSPVLAGMARSILADSGIAWLPSLRPRVSDWEQLLLSAGELFVRGVSIDFEGVDGAFAAGRCPLPTYPFQRRRFWLETEQTMAAPATAERLKEEVYYGLQWEPVDLTSLPQRQEHHTTWIIFADRGGVGDQLVQLINQAGLKAFCFHAASTSAANHAGQVQDILSRLLPQAQGEVGLVYLWPLESPAPSDGLAEDALRQCESVLGIARRLLTERQAEVRLWLGTKAALAIHGQEPIVGLSSAALWGLGRSLALEFPDRWGGLVDLDHQDAPADGANRFWEILSRQCVENQIAFRGGIAYVPRIVPTPPPLASPIDIRADATYLVSGGLGALGLRTAGWLVEKGARNLVLFGRSGLTANSEKTVADLAARGVQVLALSADVAKRDAMQALFQRIAAELPPLRGIVHAAGLPGFSPLAELSADTLRSVMTPKVAGALNLDEFARGLDLDFFVLYSSIASFWGSKGQVHYAAANSFLDGLAAQRRAQHLPATCVSWGPWQGAGMVTDDDRKTLDRMGINSLSEEQIAAALDRVVGSGRQLAVADVDWSRLHSLFESVGGAALVSRMAKQAERMPADRATGSDRFLRQWNSTEESQRPTLLRSVVGVEVARTLGIPGNNAPDPDQGFFELGMDSIMAVGLRKCLEEMLQIELSATLAFDYPSTNRLAERLNLLLAGTAASRRSDTAAAAEQVDSGGNPDLVDDPEFADNAIRESLERLEALVMRS